jgi:hypothetical protein
MARQKRLRVKRIGDKGSATRSNATTSRGKQKANGKWEVEVVRQEAGTPERMSGRGNATTSQTRGTGGHGATRGNGAMRVGDAGRWEAAARGEATQQPAGQEVREAMARREATSR